ncbi:MAG: molybdate ABC transporter substrate-binding protein [Flavobacteriaceae bacterium]
MLRFRHLGRKAGALALVLSMTLCILSGAQAGEILVFAAASTRTALEEIGARWRESTGNEAVFSFAGSSALARQIEQGAPANVFISASADWMDRLQKKNLVRPGSRIDLLGNTLVLIAHGANARPVRIAPDFDLAAMLGNGHLAMALVDSVPAGIYGKAALQSLGVWEKIAPRVAQADNVRAALALVSSGEAPFGIVYATDAAVSDQVTVVGRFPAGSHPPIVYPAAVLAGRDDAFAEAFMEFLQGDAAAAAFARQGFEVLR